MPGSVRDDRGQLEGAELEMNFVGEMVCVTLLNLRFQKRLAGTVGHGPGWSLGAGLCKKKNGDEKWMPCLFLQSLMVEWTGEKRTGQRSNEIDVSSLGSYDVLSFKKTPNPRRRQWDYTEESTCMATTM
jgi:hypothetical protein